MKQTAVEWLVNYMVENFHLTDESLSKFEQAKAMEKEQILKSRITAPFLFDVDDKHYINEAEQYYNETYGSNETTSPNN